ncbi:MAG TPA: prolipoprotein diacylglyceryl transferase [Candidatus Xenobia bacterium]
MHRILLNWPITVTSFGFMVGIGILVGAWFNLRRRDLAGLDSSAVQDALVWAILGGLLGARLLFVALNVPYFTANPGELLNTRGGGISWYGALAGGVGGLWLFARRRGLSLALILDVFAPGILAAHAIGRIGCLLNGCCWGRPSELPWAVRLVDAEPPVNECLRHPVQIYESLMDCVALALFFYLERRYKLTHGRAFLVFLVLYGTVRFLAEFWREGDLWVGPITLAQFSSLFIIGGALWLQKRLAKG